MFKAILYFPVDVRTGGKNMKKSSVEPFLLEQKTSVPNDMMLSMDVMFLQWRKKTKTTTYHFSSPTKKNLHVPIYSTKKHKKPQPHPSWQGCTCFHRQFVASNFVSSNPDISTHRHRPEKSGDVFSGHTSQSHGEDAHLCVVYGNTFGLPATQDTSHIVRDSRS